MTTGDRKHLTALEFPVEKILRSSHLHLRQFLKIEAVLESPCRHRHGRPEVGLLEDCPGKAEVPVFIPRAFPTSNSSLNKIKMEDHKSQAKAL